jgi:hypothetical protein
MERLTVYCSQPASGQMATFLMALRLGQGVVIRPLTALPQPDALRLQALRVEQGEVVEAIEDVKAHLELFQTGALQPDAGRQNGLAYKLDTLQTRLRAIVAVLSSVELGGVDNG